MPDLSLIHRSALSSAKSGRFGRSSADISLTALPEGRIIQVLASPGSGDLADKLRPLGDGNPLSIRPAGPGQWLIVGEEPTTVGRLPEYEQTLDGLAALVDQSHGRVRIAVAGKQIEQVLAKGTGVDPNLLVFPVGMSATTMIGHTNVHMTRVSSDRFEIIVMRSLALDLWNELIEMSLEFGVSAQLA